MWPLLHNQRNERIYTVSKLIIILYVKQKTGPEYFKYDLLTLELYLSKRVEASTGLDHVLVSRFLLCQLDSRVSTLVFFMDTDGPMTRQWSPTPVGLSRFVCSLNLWLSVLLVSSMYVWMLSMSHVIL